jgi:hypothetical protein
MSNYAELPLTPESLVSVLGLHAPQYEQAVLRFMTANFEGYTGGLYELRRYANGALVLALNDSEEVQTALSHQQTTLSVEAASLLANAWVSSILCEHLYSLNDEQGSQFFYENSWAIRHALQGRTSHYFDPSVEGMNRPLTPEEHKQMTSAGPHAEVNKILALLS